MAGFKTLFETALTDTSSAALGDIEGVGTVRYDEKGNRYRYVKNLEAFAARAGGPACYDLTNNGAAADFLDECTIDGAAADANTFAGIWMAAVPALGFGWIQTLGRYDEARLAIASGATLAIGDRLVPTTLTDTTATAADAAYSFILGPDISMDGEDATAVTLAVWLAPHVVALEAATALTTTLPTTHDVFVQGLCQENDGK